MIEMNSLKNMHDQFYQLFIQLLCQRISFEYNTVALSLTGVVAGADHPDRTMKLMNH